VIEMCYIFSSYIVFIVVDINKWTAPMIGEINLGIFLV
jgi:hypothetical protein